MALLPVHLLAFLGADLAEVIDIGPFVTAFVVLIVIPLALAWLTQGWARRHRSGVVISDTMTATMVPLMAVTLFLVVASQTRTVAGVVPIYVAFLIVMPFAGLAVARLFRLDVPGARAIVFTGATRNSLVVLALALALPDEYAIAATVVVTQTLVEVIGMVIYVRPIPRLAPAPPNMR